MRLLDKVAIVTGGDRGIGLAIVEAMGAEGAKVVVFTLEDEHFPELNARADRQGFRLLCIRGDVTDRVAIARAFAQAAEAFGRVDILVNNAGISLPRPFAEKTAEEWRRTLEVNLVGPSSAARWPPVTCGPKSTARSSTSPPSAASTTAAGERDGLLRLQGALINLTKTLAKELAPHINVNSVAPGHTNTGMVRALPEAVRRNMIEGAYLKRLAEPEDIAKAVVFLASDDAAFITGQVLLVDGGFHLKEN